MTMMKTLTTEFRIHASAGFGQTVTGFHHDHFEEMDELPGFNGKKEVSIHNLMSGGQAGGLMKTSSYNEAWAVHAQDENNKEKKDREFFDFLIRQTLFDSIMDNYNNIEDPYERLQYGRSLFAELTRNFAKDQHGNVDWGAEAEKRGLLDRETLSRRYGETDEQYQERIRKALAEKMLNADGSVKNEYEEDDFANALFVFNKKEEDERLVYKDLKDKMKKNAEQMAELNHRLLMMQQMREELQHIALLPALEEQSAEIELMLAGKPEFQHVDFDADGNGLVTVDDVQKTLLKQENTALEQKDTLASERIQHKQLSKDLNIFNGLDDDLYGDFMDEPKTAPAATITSTNPVL